MARSRSWSGTTRIALESERSDRRQVALALGDPHEQRVIHGRDDRPPGADHRGDRVRGPQVDRVVLGRTSGRLVDARRGRDEAHRAIGPQHVDDADVAQRRDGDRGQRADGLVDVERGAEHLADPHEQLQTPLSRLRLGARRAVLVEGLLQLEPRRRRRAAYGLRVLTSALDERGQRDRHEPGEDEQQQPDAVHGADDREGPDRAPGRSSPRRR